MPKERRWAPRLHFSKRQGTVHIIYLVYRDDSYCQTRFRCDLDGNTLVDSPGVATDHKTVSRFATRRPTFDTGNELRRVAEKPRDVPYH